MRQSCLQRVLIIIILMLTTCVANIEAHEPAHTQENEARAFVVDNEVYNQVVDMLFPRKVLVGAFGYAFVIRFQPPFDKAESQITILNKAGQIEVIEYRSLDGNIRGKLDKIFERTRRQDVAEMAKQIRVEKRVVNVPPAEVARLRQSFYDHVCQAANFERKQLGENMQEWVVTEDATAYLLWYRGIEESFYELSGSALDSSPIENESPLVSWIREVRHTLKKFSTADSRKP